MKLKSLTIKSRKGAMTDLFLWMAIAFIIVLFSVIMYSVATNTYSVLRNNKGLQEGLGESGNATSIVDDTFGKVVVAYQSLKWITFMLIFGFAMSILMTNFLVKTNPIYFVPYTIILVIAVIVSVPLSNTYETIYQNPLLAESFSGFWGATWIFLNLPIWVSVIGMIAGALMFINAIRNY